MPAESHGNDTVAHFSLSLFHSTLTRGELCEWTAHDMVFKRAGSLQRTKPPPAAGFKKWDEKSGAESER